MTTIATKLVLAGSLLLSLSACAPANFQKCTKDFFYDETGKVVSEYSECVTQEAGKIPLITMRHQELLK